MFFIFDNIVFGSRCFCTGYFSLAGQFNAQESTSLLVSEITISLFVLSSMINSCVNVFWFLLLVHFNGVFVFLFLGSYNDSYVYIQLCGNGTLRFFSYFGPSGDCQTGLRHLKWFSAKEKLKDYYHYCLWGLQKCTCNVYEKTFESVIKIQNIHGRRNIPEARKQGIIYSFSSN